MYFTPNCGATSISILASIVHGLFWLNKTFEWKEFTHSWKYCYNIMVNTNKKTLSRSWLINCIHALYTTSALVNRCPKNEVILKAIVNDGPDKTERISEPRWTLDSDVDLMQWATEIPSDWQLSGKCSAFLFGCSGHGELADAGKQNQSLNLKLTSHCRML